MKRFVVVLFVLVGSHQPPSSPTPVAPEVSIAPPPRLISQTALDFESLDFTQWPTATDFPIDVNPLVARACGFSYGNDQLWARIGGEKRHGPHANHTITVRVNTETMEAFKSVGTPLPAGTVVIKEKHPDRSTTRENPASARASGGGTRRHLADWSAARENPANEFGAMIKREAGYDPENGDWEYVYVVRGPANQVTRGRLASCIDCHAHIKDRDYLFRTYLPNQVEGAQKRHPAVSDW